MKKTPEKPALKRKVVASFELMADFRSLYEIRRVIVAQARTLGISRGRIYRVLVAVEEACSNVLRHAYDDKDAKLLSIEIETTRRQVKVLIRDIGKPFNFERYPSASMVKVAVKNRERGGYGIHLIKNLMDKYEYIRNDNGENHLRLIKYLSR